MKKTMLLVWIAAWSLAPQSVNADFILGFPVSLEPPVNSSSSEDGLSISADGLSLFFASDRPGGGGWDLWMATRQTTDYGWGPAVNLGPVVNSPHGEGYPSLSMDGLELFFCSFDGPSQRPGSFGAGDLWVTRRASLYHPWGPPENLGSVVNTDGRETEPSISADGLCLYFASDRPGGEGGLDLYVTTRPTREDPWCAPVNLGPAVNGAGNDMSPCVSASGLTLFYRSAGSAKNSGSDICVTTRATTCDAWREPTSLMSCIDSPGIRRVSGISPDARTLYLTVEEAQAGSDLVEASLLPMVDFNSDGITDGTDLALMTDHLGENAPQYDIGPCPLGDGVVDTQDLHVLVEHIVCPLLARYAFDEVQGAVAHDGAGPKHATLIGEPTWQPEGGVTGGALELDGIGDGVFTTLVMNPADGPFSVFAWVQGGGPNQAVISQHGGVNWLMLDPVDGTLTTELGHAGRLSPPLDSGVVVTDGAWHRLGLVWDGTDRILYVDDVEVARDTQLELAYSSGVVLIGCHGENLDVDRFFSGRIDDVRIYNCAVTP